MLGDWLTAGIAVSCVCGLASLICSYMLFLRVGGEAAAWGAALTLMGSGIFITESARASADVMFFALFMGSCLLALEGLRSGSRRLWAACGLVVGLALITRTNALPLLLLALAPFLGPDPRRARLADCLSLIAGVVLPIAVIVAYGGTSGSHVWPTNNHLSLATSFYAEGEDRNSTDAALQVAGRFGSITEVLLHDPARIAAIYLRDLYQLSANVTTLVEFPLGFMFLPGLFLLIGRQWSGAFAVVLAVAMAELLLTNLLSLPGAADRCGGRPHVLAYSPLGVVLTGTDRRRDGRCPDVCRRDAKTFKGTQNGMAELFELLPATLGRIEDGSAVVARKPHLAFYSGAADIHLPDVSTLDELHDFLRLDPFQTPLYLLYGQIERRLRPQFHALQSADGAPDWLEVVAESAEPGQWLLYRYKRPETD